mmetsp:Transcript_39758/g.83600  ORF Transcript_39758/g.83600 Transcript_39758/m.83600 type:complete len:1353 (+) Transcript_39758:240-4298(+)
MTSPNIYEQNSARRRGSTKTKRRGSEHSLFGGVECILPSGSTNSWPFLRNENNGQSDVATATASSLSSLSSMLEDEELWAEFKIELSARNLKTDMGIQGMMSKFVAEKRKKQQEEDDEEEKRNPTRMSVNSADSSEGSSKRNLLRRFSSTLSVFSAAPAEDTFQQQPAGRRTSLVPQESSLPLPGRRGSNDLDVEDKDKDTSKPLPGRRSSVCTPDDASLSSLSLPDPELSGDDGKCNGSSSYRHRDTDKTPMVDNYITKADEKTGEGEERQTRIPPSKSWSPEMQLPQKGDIVASESQSHSLTSGLNKMREETEKVTELDRNRTHASIEVSQTPPAVRGNSLLKDWFGFAGNRGGGYCNNDRNKKAKEESAPDKGSINQPLQSENSNIEHKNRTMIPGRGQNEVTHDPALAQEMLKQFMQGYNESSGRGERNQEGGSGSQDVSILRNANVPLSHPSLYRPNLKTSSLEQSSSEAPRATEGSRWEQNGTQQTKNVSARDPSSMQEMLKQLTQTHIESSGGSKRNHGGSDSRCVGEPSNASVPSSHPSSHHPNCKASSPEQSSSEDPQQSGSVALQSQTSELKPSCLKKKPSDNEATPPPVQTTDSDCGQDQGTQDLLRLLLSLDSGPGKKQKPGRPSQNSRSSKIKQKERSQEESEEARSEEKKMEEGRSGLPQSPNDRNTPKIRDPHSEDKKPSSLGFKYKPRRKHSSAAQPNRSENISLDSVGNEKQGGRSRNREDDSSKSFTTASSKSSNGSDDSSSMKRHMRNMMSTGSIRDMHKRHIPTTNADNANQDWSVMNQNTASSTMHRANQLLPPSIATSPLMNKFPSTSMMSTGSSKDISRRNIPKTAAAKMMNQNWSTPTGTPMAQMNPLRQQQQVVSSNDALLNSQTIVLRSSTNTKDVNQPFAPNPQVRQDQGFVSHGALLQMRKQHQHQHQQLSEKELANRQAALTKIRDLKKRHKERQQTQLKSSGNSQTLGGFVTMVDSIDLRKDQENEPSKSQEKKGGNAGVQCAPAASGVGSQGQDQFKENSHTVSSDLFSRYLENKRNESVESSKSTPSKRDGKSSSCPANDLMDPQGSSTHKPTVSGELLVNWGDPGEDDDDEEEEGDFQEKIEERVDSKNFGRPLNYTKPIVPKNNEPQEDTVVWDHKVEERCITIDHQEAAQRRVSDITFTDFEEDRGCITINHKDAAMRRVSDITTDFALDDCKEEAEEAQAPKALRRRIRSLSIQEEPEEEDEFIDDIILSVSPSKYSPPQSYLQPNVGCVENGITDDRTNSASQKENGSDEDYAFFWSGNKDGNSDPPATPRIVSVQPDAKGKIDRTTSFTMGEGLIRNMSRETLHEEIIDELSNI